MARIRSIKPEFPQSETIGRLSRDARLLFIQLWTLADDSGRSRASSRMLASLLYPYDDDASGLIDRWLTELSKNDCIRLYEADDNQYLEIVKWLKHQKIDHPGKSKIPEFSEILAKPRETFATDLGPRTIGPRKEKKEYTLSNGVKVLLDGKGPAKSDPRDNTQFKIFWTAYPKQTGEKPAAKAFAQAIKETSLETMLAALVRQINSDWKDREIKFIPEAANWLKNGRWADKPTRPRQETFSGIT